MPGVMVLDLVARVPPRERERESERASQRRSRRASKRARERDRVAQGRWSESGTLSRLAAAAGLAPDVKFRVVKLSFISHFDFDYRYEYRPVRFDFESLDRSIGPWRARAPVENGEDRGAGRRQNVSGMARVAVYNQEQCGCDGTMR